MGQGGEAPRNTEVEVSQEWKSTGHNPPKGKIEKKKRGQKKMSEIG